jgi:glycosyltransferase involved in cell wall biosynthesis
MRKEQPLVSILMTSYNREKYIADAIESVLASTFTDFEMIIVDDNSKDSTLNIAKSYAAKDTRIKVFVNDSNLGDYKNRNKASSYAIGKYIKYVDADDTIYPWGLGVVVNYMEQFPEAGYGLDSLEQDPDRPFPILLDPKEAYERHYFFMPVFHKAPTSCIIRREVFIECNGFSGKWMVGDFELWLKLSRTKNVLLMPMGIVWSRVHDEQESKKTRDNSSVLFRYFVVELENLKDSNCPLSSSKKNLLIKRIIRAQSTSILRSLFIDKDIKVAKEKMKMSGLTILSCIANAFKKRK